MTAATETATHYRLSIELSTHHAPDTSSGQPGEVVTLADLIATDEATGRRWVYVGRMPCVTQGEALEIMAAIYTWERTAGRTLDPTRKPACWVAENGPSVPVVAPTADVAHPVEVTAPVAHAASTADLVADNSVPASVAAAVAVVDIGRRVRGKRVDAAKARRAKAVMAGALAGVGVAGVAVVG